MIQVHVVIPTFQTLEFCTNFTAYSPIHENSPAAIFAEVKAMARIQNRTSLEKHISSVSRSLTTYCNKFSTFIRRPLADHTQSPLEYHSPFFREDTARQPQRLNPFGSRPVQTWWSRSNSLRRHKRGAPLIVLAVAGGIALLTTIIGIGAWLGGAFSSGSTLAEHTHQLNGLNDNQRIIKSAISQLNDIQQDAAHVSRIIDALTLTEFQIQSYIQTLDAAIDQIDAASRNILLMKLVQYDDLARILLRAQSIAKRNKLLCPFSDPADLVKIPAVLSHNSTTAEYRISFLIPLSTESVDVIGITDAPIVADDNTDTPKLINIVTNDKVVAISGDGMTTAPLNQQFLSSCITVNELLICPNRIPLSPTIHTCAQALARRDSRAASSLCSFELAPHPVHASPHLDSGVTITSAIETTATFNCINHDSFTPKISSYNISVGSSEFTIPPGCTVFTPFSATPGRPVLIETITIYKSLTWDLNNDILDGHSMQDIAHATALLNKHGKPVPTDVKDILSRAKDLPLLTVDEATSSTWIIICLVLIIILTCFCCLCTGLGKTHKSLQRTKHFNQSVLGSVVRATKTNISRAASMLSLNQQQQHPDDRHHKQQPIRRRQTQHDVELQPVNEPLHHTTTQPLLHQQPQSLNIYPQIPPADPTRPNNPFITDIPNPDEITPAYQADDPLLLSPNANRRRRGSLSSLASARSLRSVASQAARHLKPKAKAAKHTLQKYASRESLQSIAARSASSMQSIASRVSRYAKRAKKKIPKKMKTITKHPSIQSLAESASKKVKSLKRHPSVQSITSTTARFHTRAKKAAKAATAEKNRRSLISPMPSRSTLMKALRKAAAPPKGSKAKPHKLPKVSKNQGPSEADKIVLKTLAKLPPPNPDCP